MPVGGAGLVVLARPAPLGVRRRLQRAVAALADFDLLLSRELRRIDDERDVGSAENVVRPGAVARLARDVHGLERAVSVVVEIGGVVDGVERRREARVDLLARREEAVVLHPGHVTADAAGVGGDRREVGRLRGRRELRQVLRVVPAGGRVRDPLLRRGAPGERREVVRLRDLRVGVRHGDADRKTLVLTFPAADREDDRVVDRADGDEIRPVLHRELRRVRLVDVEHRADGVEVEAVDEVVLSVAVLISHDPLVRDRRVVGHGPAEKRRVQRVLELRVGRVAREAVFRPDVDALLDLGRGVIAEQDIAQASGLEDLRRGDRYGLRVARLGQRLVLTQKGQRHKRQHEQEPCGVFHNGSPFVFSLIDESRIAIRSV